MKTGADTIKSMADTLHTSADHEHVSALGTMVTDEKPSASTLLVLAAELISLCHADFNAKASLPLPVAEAVHALTLRYCAARERTQGGATAKTWWYLSFATKDAFQGGLIIGPARTASDALALANAHNLRPQHGDALPVPIGNEPPPEEYRFRLLSEDEVHEMDERLCAELDAKGLN